MKRLAALFLLLVFGGLTARGQAQPAAIAPASPALVAALTAARAGGMADLTAWATQSAPDPAAAAPGAIVAQVASLTPPDRDALVYWLRGHGRGALHAQGANDAQIGIPYYALDYAIVPGTWPETVPQLPAPPPIPTPTPAPRHHSSFWHLLAAGLPNVSAPVAQSSSSSTSTSPDGSTTTTQSSSSSVSVGVNTGALLAGLIDAADAHGSAQSPSSAWRQLPFGATTLSAAGTPSPIAITHGIASVRYDGTEGFACLSFANNAAQPVTEIDVDITIIDGLGYLTRALQLRRTGSFAPGAAIDGPTSLREVSTAQPNCVIDGENGLADPTNPFSGAALVGYAIRRVTFADGTFWIEPGANPWPATGA